MAPVLQRLPHLTLSASGLSDPESFETYRQAVSTIFDATLDDWQQQPDFRVHVDCVQLGPMLLSQASMANADYRYERSMKKVAQVGAEAMLVQIVLAGSDVRMVKDEAIVSGPGDVFICDLTRTISTRAKDCRNFTFVFPRSLLGLPDLELDGLHDIYLPASSTQAKLLLAHVQMLWSERERITLPDAAMFAQSTAGLIASLTVNSIDHDVRQAHASRAEIARVQHFVDSRLMDAELGPDMICSRLGFSRSSLYRLFEPLGGVASYIRDRRLRRVFRQLASRQTSHRKLAEIAFDTGFSNIPAFTRAFKAQYGVTPRDVRMLAEAGSGWPMRLDEPTDGGERLGYWLNRLGKA